MIHFSLQLEQSIPDKAAKSAATPTSPQHKSNKEDPRYYPAPLVTYEDMVSYNFNTVWNGHFRAYKRVFWG